MPSKVLDEMTYPFPSSRRCTVKVREKKGQFTHHFLVDVIIHPCCDQSQSIILKGTHGRRYYIAYDNQHIGIMTIWTEM